MKGYIYQIINKVDGRRYVGQTINLEKRKQTHFSKLRKNQHPNKLLQDAWNEWGEENFSFIYEEVDIKDNNTLNEAEINTISKYNSYLDGYNRTPGGQGGIIKRKLTYEDFCFIYYGCQWQGMTEKIANYLHIDASTVSSILREKAHLDYLIRSKELSKEEIEKIQFEFKEIFNIPKDKEKDKNRVPTHISEEEYFYCFCIASTYGRGIETALGNFFNKHKTFLSNGIKGKVSGKVVSAKNKFLQLPKEEIEQIGEMKFKEWELDKYSKIKIKKEINDKWRN